VDGKLETAAAEAAAAFDNEFQRIHRVFQKDTLNNCEATLIRDKGVSQIDDHLDY